MTDSTFTLAQMAGIFCGADERSEKEKGEVWNQLRGLHHRGILSELDRRGPGGATRFTLEEAVCGRLLTTAVQMGIGTVNLDSLDAQIRHGGSRSQSPIPKDSHDYTLQGFVESLSDPEADWVLTVRVGFFAGDVQRTAIFHPANVPPPATTAPVTISMAATRLVRPLLNAER